MINDTKKCACGEPTCVEPWEPGCGLGLSPEHLVAAQPECTCPSGDGSLRWPCPAHPSAPVGSSRVQTALRNLPQYIGKSGLAGPDKQSALECVDTLRVALAQKPAAAQDEETAWREGWALAYSGADKLYGDDGELQDASDHPFIDWRRDSATEIRGKIQERGMRALSRLGGES